MFSTLSPKHLIAKSKNKIDPKLIYEIFDGKPIYFQGYKNVINGIKSKEEIIGSSGLQIMIIQYFLMHVLRSLDLKKY